LHTGGNCREHRGNGGTKLVHPSALVTDACATCAFHNLQTSGEIRKRVKFRARDNNDDETGWSVMIFTYIIAHR